MKTKHTTGNWIAKEGQIYPQETGKTLAFVPYFDEEDEEQQANLMLIAAAPLLLHACKFLVGIMTSENKEFYQRHVHAFNLGREAIEKATKY